MEITDYKLNELENEKSIIISKNTASEFKKWLDM